MPVRVPRDGAPPGRAGRLESLTGLRFVAALAVFSLHLALLNRSTPYARWMFRYVVQGGAGVSFFFILSGFVLTWSHPGRDTAGAFYRRRAARILPNHVLTWAGMGAVLAVFTTLPPAGPALGSLLLLQPWVPSPRWYLAMNTPAWSLGCEACFYALFPFLLPLLRALAPARRAVRMGLGVQLAVAVAVLAGPDRAGSTGAWLMYFFPPVRLIEFILGILLALGVAEGRWPRVPLPAAALVAAGAYLAAGWAPAAYQNVAVTLVPFCLLIVAGAQSDRDPRAGRAQLLSRRLPVTLGRWSFAFYLVHFPLLATFGLLELHHPMSGWAAVLNALVELAACLAAAGLVFQLFEMPLERRLRPRPAAGAG